MDIFVQNAFKIPLCVCVCVCVCVYVVEPPFK